MFFQSSYWATPPMFGKLQGNFHALKDTTVDPETDLRICQQVPGLAGDLWDTRPGQWEFQDPEMEVLYHIRSYFLGIFPYIGLNNRPYIYGKYLQFRFLKWPLIW